MDEYRPLSDPQADLPGTVRQLDDGAVYVKSDTNEGVAPAWSVIVRGVHRTDASLFSVELTDSPTALAQSTIVGVVPYSPAEAAEYLASDRQSGKVEYHFRIRPHSHDVVERLIRSHLMVGDGAWMESSWSFTGICASYRVTTHRTGGETA